MHVTGLQQAVLQFEPVALDAGMLLLIETLMEKWNSLQVVLGIALAEFWCKGAGMASGPLPSSKQQCACLRVPLCVRESIRCDVIRHEANAARQYLSKISLLMSYMQYAEENCE